MHGIAGEVDSLEVSMLTLANTQLAKTHSASYDYVMDADFFDRKDELAMLERAWASDRAELVTVWGRRRVGKSALLGEFAASHNAIYIYGTRASQRDTLDDLATIAARRFDDEFLAQSSFPSWDAALAYLAQRATDARLAVIFDEFGYLCEVTPGLDTIVQRWWDRTGKTANILVVVASSGFSFMRELTGGRGALHGRRTAQIEVHPFDHADAAPFFAELDPIDRVRAYACLGGLPAYLQHWRHGLGLAGNLRASLLQPGHMLFSEAQELLSTEFHQEALYASILRAIAGGDERLSEIARAVGRHSVNEILGHVQRLVELRFVRRDAPITEASRERSRRALYRLADPYLRFWFRFVAPNRGLLQSGHGAEVWDSIIAPALDEFVARTAWEEVVQQHLWRRLRAGTLPRTFSDLGRWWDSRDEIDVVGMQGDHAVVVGECKWTNRELTEGDLADLQRKAQHLPLAENPLWILAGRSGFHPVLRARAEFGDLLLVTPEDLFDPAVAG